MSTLKITLMISIEMMLKNLNEMKPLTTLTALLIAMSAAGQTYTSWTDSNKDGCADGWKCRQGQPAIIETAGFTTNAQQIADMDYYLLSTKPDYPKAGKQMLKFRYIASGEVSVTVIVAEGISQDIITLPPTLTPVNVVQEYWVPGQLSIEFTGVGWLQIDDVEMWPVKQQTVKLGEWKEMLHNQKLRK